MAVAGCTEKDAEPDAATASEMSTSTSTSSGTGGTDGSSSTTGGGSAPTGTAGESGTEGQDTGSSDTTVTAGETGAPGGPGFAVDIWPILDASCACHKDSGGAGMLRLGSDDAYANLVDKPSTQAKTMLLVAPGSSVDSYLWYKLNDTQLEAGGYGMRMPSGGLLDPAEIEIIQQWIDAGANP